MNVRNNPTIKWINEHQNQWSKNRIGSPLYFDEGFSSIGMFDLTSEGVFPQDCIEKKWQELFIIDISKWNLCAVIVTGVLKKVRFILTTLTMVTAAAVAQWVRVCGRLVVRLLAATDLSRWNGGAVGKSVRKVGCSTPSCDRPKSSKQAVTAPLPNARH